MLRGVIVLVLIPSFFFFNISMLGLYNLIACKKRELHFYKFNIRSSYMYYFEKLEQVSEKKKIKFLSIHARDIYLKLHTCLFM